MQTRDLYVQKRSLEFYRHLDSSLISLPFDIMKAATHIKNLRIITYRKFAERHGIPLEDVSRYAESNDGVTHYNRETNQYIILYNDEQHCGRQRFTLAHEVGHIALKHLTTLAVCKASLNNLYEISDAKIEREADWFASMVLCPFPVLRKLGVCSPEQIQNICDISSQASLIKYEQYTEWSKYHRKTALENDIARLFATYIDNYNATQNRCGVDYATTGAQSPKLI